MNTTQRPQLDWVPSLGLAFIDGLLISPSDPLWQSLWAAEHPPSPTTDSDSQQIAKRTNKPR